MISKNGQSLLKLEEYLSEVENYEDMGPSKLESLIDVDIGNLIQIIRILMPNVDSSMMEGIKDILRERESE